MPDHKGLCGNKGDTSTWPSLCRPNVCIRWKAKDSRWGWQPGGQRQLPPRSPPSNISFNATRDNKKGKPSHTKSLHSAEGQWGGLRGATLVWNHRRGFLCRTAPAAPADSLPVGQPQLATFSVKVSKRCPKFIQLMKNRFFVLFCFV